MKENQTLSKPYIEDFINWFNDNYDQPGERFEYFRGSSLPRKLAFEARIRSWKLFLAFKRHDQKDTSWFATILSKPHRPCVKDAINSLTALAYEEKEAVKMMLKHDISKSVISGFFIYKTINEKQFQMLEKET